VNSLAPYAAFFMRLAVGGVFLSRGLDRIQGGHPEPVAGFPLGAARDRDRDGRGGVRAARDVDPHVGHGDGRLHGGDNHRDQTAASRQLRARGPAARGRGDADALGDGPLSIGIRFKKTSA